MKPTAKHSNLRLASETIRSLVAVQLGKELPAATTLSTCVGGCKANSRICSL